MRPKDLYQIKWRKRGSRKWHYGIVENFDQAAIDGWETHRALLVNDAVMPIYDWVYVDIDEIVSIPCRYPSEYDKFVSDQLKKAQEKSKKATGLVGKLFSLPVADGAAYYVVVKENKKTLKVEWRGFCLDRYQDMFLQDGGSFPKNRIESLIRSQEGLAELFAKSKEITA